MKQAIVQECASTADSALELLVDRMRVAREAVAVARMRRQHGDALDGAGADVTRISSPEEALERVTWCKPDVVVSALDRAGMDGCEFLTPADQATLARAVAKAFDCIVTGQ